MRHLFLALLSIISVCASAGTPFIDFITPTIVRVRWNPEGVKTDNATGVCRTSYTPVDVKTERRGGVTCIQSDSLKVEVSDKGKIDFFEKSGDRFVRVLSTADQAIAVRAFDCDTVVRERVVYDDASARMEDTANGKVTVKDVISRDTIGISRRFRMSFINEGEALYGLGSQMEDYMNLMGKNLYLTQHNLKIMVPMLVSTKGYGLLFDAGCSMKFESDPLLRSGNAPYAQMTTIEFEAANTVDYYFIMGSEMEQVIEGYRYLTGNVSMMPRYLFGYTQSKERYVSSDDIVNTVKEYRRRHVPLDMIVQDWNYWPQGWGYMKMNRQYYPDPKALADSVHALDAKLMVSIWANPQYCPEEEDFRSKGLMLEHSVYDAFNPDARDLYWQYADNEFFSNGFDAWWCDSSEPLDGDWNQIPEPVNGKPYGWDDHERRWHLNDAVLSEALGAERACLYSLNHAKGIYDHQRAATDRKRVVNLTRSSFAGQQKYGTIVWNGDTHASWNSFKQQIPSGLNYFATGNPYWTVDVGSFFTKNGGRWFWKGEFPEGVKDDAYKEYYTRMFQWGTFLPVLRSHGTDTPREIWQFGEEGSPYYDAILKMIKLRYSLLPYIYSMADRQTRSGFSMARPLAFDFPKDVKVHDIKDQYMFGDIMVCPVTDPGVESREVYLPAGSEWIDFWTGKRFAGGEVITADAPLSSLPLFVKGGSIILTTEPVEHSGASVGQPVNIDIYPGRDATFTLYDDAGDTYDFEKGEYTRINLDWNDAKGVLTISEAEGTYPENLPVRNLVVRKDGKTKKVNYKGKKTVVKI
ncbi:MAG: glycoside hydrolase family 31 protein [Muribaculaceae bacterium]|nr:glycoside hydrolase family 31 protein [Muribaculaceae bacterium]